MNRHFDQSIDNGAESLSESEAGDCDTETNRFKLLLKVLTLSFKQSNNSLYFGRGGGRFGWVSLKKKC